MSRIRFALLGAVIAALVIAATASAAPVKLSAVVGPSFNISLKKGAKKVTTLKAGKYTFVIADKAPIHSFSLDGPNGLAKTLTTVPFKGQKSVTMTLRKGSYKFYCEAHESTMFGKFKVS
jgi:plastocyanin